MRVAAGILVGMIALAHLWFLVLEMFLWKTPLGRKTFGATPEAAETSVCAGEPVAVKERA